MKLRCKYRWIIVCACVVLVRRKSKHSGRDLVGYYCLVFVLATLLPTFIPVMVLAYIE